VEISSQEVHIWSVNLDSAQVDAGVLSPDERARAERLRFERDKRRFVARRVVLRDILSRYTGIAPQSLIFEYSPYGKPLLGSGAVQFNLTDADHIALYAVTSQAAVGIDVEPIHVIPERDDIARRMFSARENAIFHALPEQQKDEAFANCWTRKEAFIKAIGEGLSHPLDVFDVTLTPGEAARILQIRGNSKEAARWFLLELHPAVGYRGALAVRDLQPRVSFWQWTPR
jgi:4'-phosphopantetheinyl transferase